MNTAEKTYTADEFLSMTDLEGRYELIGGVITSQNSPSQEHQRSIKRLTGAIDRYIIDNKGKCEVFLAPSDVKLDDRNVVQPDVYVVCDPEKLDEHKCSGAPDMVIEILSESTADNDLRKKLYLYFETGVREYWLVDPEFKRVTVYIFDDTKNIGFYTFNDEIPVYIYKDAPIPLTLCIKKLLESAL